MIPLSRSQIERPMQDASIAAGRLLDQIDQLRQRVAALEADKRRLRGRLALSEKREQALRKVAFKRPHRTRADHSPQIPLKWSA